MVTLDKADMVPGSGILTQHFSPGELSPRDAVRLMIVYSGQHRHEFGAGPDRHPHGQSTDGGVETAKHAHQRQGVSRQHDLGRPGTDQNVRPRSTTARESVALGDDSPRHGRQAARKEMLDHLKNATTRTSLPVSPAGVTVAHKTGSVNDARTDTGILYFKQGPVAAVRIDRENEDQKCSARQRGQRARESGQRSVRVFFSK